MTGGVNRLSDRRIWPQKSHGLWIFAVNRADWRILKRLWIVDQLQFLARIPDCACLMFGSWVLNEIWIIDLSSALVGMLLKFVQIISSFERSYCYWNCNVL